MNIAYVMLQKELDEFNEMKEELHELQQTVEHEILHIDRFIKKEVIDMADNIDFINDKIIEQENSI